MTADPEAARRCLGASAALWAGESGVSTRPHGWTAFSGLRSIDYNVVLGTGAGDDLDGCVDQIAQAGVPAVLMVAGAALGEVQRLVSRSWVCIGATPVMERALHRDEPPVAAPARRLGSEDRVVARALVAGVFAVDDGAARVALPDSLDGRDPRHGLWGAFDGRGVLRSCLALVRVQDAVVVWSMATAAETRGAGHGRRALQAGLAAAAADGATRSLLYASPLGEGFYRRLGYVELERWQMWSRPRWSLGRA